MKESGKRIILAMDLIGKKQEVKTNNIVWKRIKVCNDEDELNAILEFVSVPNNSLISKNSQSVLWVIELLKYFLECKKLP